MISGNMLHQKATHAAVVGSPCGPRVNLRKNRLGMSFVAALTIKGHHGRCIGTSVAFDTGGTGRLDSTMLRRVDCCSVLLEMCAKEESFEEDSGGSQPVVETRQYCYLRRMCSCSLPRTRAAIATGCPVSKNCILLGKSFASITKARNNSNKQPVESSSCDLAAPTRSVWAGYFLCASNLPCVSHRSPSSKIRWGVRLERCSNLQGVKGTQRNT